MLNHGVKQSVMPNSIKRFLEINEVMVYWFFLFLHFSHKIFNLVICSVVLLFLQKPACTSLKMCSILDVILPSMLDTANPRISPLGAYLFFILLGGYLFIFILLGGGYSSWGRIPGAYKIAVEIKKILLKDLVYFSRNFFINIYFIITKV